MIASFWKKLVEQPKVAAHALVVEKIGENSYSNGMTKQEEFISEFLDSATIEALKDFIEKSEIFN